MNRKTIYILIFAMLLSACGKWLDVRPYDQISEDDLLETEEGFQKLLNGIYIELNSMELYGGSLSVEMIEIMGGAYEIGDNTNVWGNYVALKDYDYASDYWRTRFGATWNKAYAMILNCNKILDNIDGSKDKFSGINYQIIKGEALALRAMLHFDMLRLFGPVYSLDPDAAAIPYCSSVSLTVQPLLTAREAVERILRDLNEARAALIVDPIITEGTMMSPSVNGDNFLRYRALRLNFYAVDALIARVCLYAGDREEAMSMANEIIRAVNKGTFSFVSMSSVLGAQDDPDRIFSTEVIFALSSTKRGKMFLDYFSPARTTFTFRMESDLINNVIYGGGTTTGGYQDDWRNRTCWSTSGANRYFYKYADMVQPGRIENTMVPMLRLGEIYLIAAESQSDVLANGTSYVNTLRRNRGISQTMAELTPELLHYEYMRELYGEGQLFFFSKRRFTDIIRSRTASRNTAPSRDVFVVPLPDTETENREEK